METAAERPEAVNEDDVRRRNEDAFDDLVDKVTGPEAQWGFEEGVHVASNLYDAAGHGPPYPADYVPRERRRLVTGGA